MNRVNFSTLICDTGFSELVAKYKSMSREESLMRQAELYNSSDGGAARDGEYDCPICKNKRLIFLVSDGEIVTRPCKCAKIRRALYELRKSGLAESVMKNSFENYEVKEAWQADVKRRAVEFCNDPKAKAFYICGQSGAGKTHICTAITLTYINRGVSCKYMLWRDESVRLKAAINDAEEYGKRMDEIKNVDFLYVDDFLRVNQGAMPSPADINLAFEIVNSRFAEGKITIFSSELLTDELVRIDEAISGRIFEHTGTKYCIAIPKDRAKNHRFNFQ